MLKYQQVHSLLNNYKCGEIFCLTAAIFNVTCSLCNRQMGLDEFASHFQVQHLALAEECIQIEEKPEYLVDDSMINDSAEDPISQDNGEYNNIRGSVDNPQNDGDENINKHRDYNPFRQHDAEDANYKEFEKDLECNGIPLNENFTQHDNENAKKKIIKNYNKKDFSQHENDAATKANSGKEAKNKLNLNILRDCHDNDAYTLYEENSNANGSPKFCMEKTMSNGSNLHPFNNHQNEDSVCDFFVKLPNSFTYKKGQNNSLSQQRDEDDKIAIFDKKSQSDMNRAMLKDSENDCFGSYEDEADVNELFVKNSEGEMNESILNDNFAFSDHDDNTVINEDFEKEPDYYIDDEMFKDGDKDPFSQYEYDNGINDIIEKKEQCHIDQKMIDENNKCHFRQHTDDDDGDNYNLDKIDTMSTNENKDHFGQHDDKELQCYLEKTWSKNYDNDPFSQNYDDEDRKNEYLLKHSCTDGYKTVTSDRIDNAFMSIQAGDTIIRNTNHNFSNNAKFDDGLSSNCNELGAKKTKRKRQKAGSVVSDISENYEAVNTCKTNLEGIKMEDSVLPNEMSKQKLEEVGNLEESLMSIPIAADQNETDMDWPLRNAEENDDGTEDINVVNDDLPLPFPCLTCKRSYRSKQSLQKHNSTVHNPNKPARKMTKSILAYKCEDCNECFRSERELRGHRWKHTGIFCDICGKRFTQTGNLMRHKIRHTGIKAHKCQQCGKDFFTDKELKSHMISHTGLMAHMCEVCGKRCRDRGVLTAHMRRHTGERPAKCELCDKSFFSFHDLNVHAVTHTNERPFQCDICNSTFQRKKALRVHKLIHTKRRQHLCKICAKPFTQLARLHSHLRTHDATVVRKATSNPYAITIKNFPVSPEATTDKNRLMVEFKNSETSDEADIKDFGYFL